MGSARRRTPARGLDQAFRVVLISISCLRLSNIGCHTVLYDRGLSSRFVTVVIASRGVSILCSTVSNVISSCRTGVYSLRSLLPNCDIDSLLDVKGHGCRRRFATTRPRLRRLIRYRCHCRLSQTEILRIFVRACCRRLFYLSMPS